MQLGGRDRSPEVPPSIPLPVQGLKVAHDGTVRVWEVASGRALHTLRGHQRGVENVAFSPDGANLGVAGTDGRSCFMKVWDGVPRQEEPAKR